MTKLLLLLLLVVVVGGSGGSGAGAGLVDLGVCLVPSNVTVCNHLIWKHRSQVSNSFQVILPSASNSIRLPYHQSINTK